MSKKEIDLLLWGLVGAGYPVLVKHLYEKLMEMERKERKKIRKVSPC